MPGPNRPYSSSTSPRLLKARERTQQAFELRKAGATYEFIAQALGYSDRSTAFRALKDYLKNHLADQETVEEVRMLELERLDYMLTRVWPLVGQSDLAAIDRALAIMRQRSMLLGTDAPIKVTGKDGGPIQHAHAVLVVQGDTTDEYVQTLQAMAGELRESPEQRQLEAPRLEVDGRSVRQDDGDAQEANPGAKSARTRRLAFPSRAKNGRVPKVIEGFERDDESDADGDGEVADE